MRLFSCGLFWVTVPSSKFDTQTCPAPKATRCWPLPIAVLRRSSVSGSMRVRRVRRLLGPQTWPPPVVTSATPSSPIRTARVSPVLGEIRSSADGGSLRLTARRPTHPPPAPAAPPRALAARQRRREARAELLVGHPAAGPGVEAQQPALVAVEHPQR